MLRRIAVPGRDPVRRSAPALRLSRSEPDRPVWCSRYPADVHRGPDRRRLEHRRTQQGGIERIHRLPALDPVAQRLAEIERAGAGQSAHPQAAIRRERQAEPVAEHRGMLVVARSTQADPRVHVVGVPDLLVVVPPGIGRIAPRREVLRRDDARDAVVRPDVEVPRVLEVIVDHAHHRAGLVVPPVVGVAQVVAVDRQRAVGVQQHLVHLAHVRDRVGVPVRVGEHRGVGVVGVVTDECLAGPAALDHGEVGRLGVPRADVQPVLRGVAAEDLGARLQHVERLFRRHPQVLAFVHRR